MMTAPTPVPHPSPLALIADGDGDTRDMYAEYLRHSSWRVELVEDGASALARAIALHPDIVITELQLPFIDGYELMRILKTDPHTRDIPIVVVTSDVFARDVERARRAGGAAVLAKPCLPETLLEAAKDALAAAPRRDTRESIPRGRDAFAHAGLQPAPPPAEVFCTMCGRPLTWLRSHVGGVNEKLAEQWDYFRCPAGCGEFQYRHRTRRLRRVS